MTELLVLLVVALLICLIFMCIMTYMYFRLSSAFKTYVNSAVQTEDKRSKTEWYLINSMDSVISYLETLLPEAKALRNRAQEVLDIATEKAVHARDTMQNARKLLTVENNVFPEGEEACTQIAEETKAEEKQEEDKKPFVFVEKEEDPNEPRS